MPWPGEPVISKQANSAFIGTGFEETYVRPATTHSLSVE